MATAVPPPAGGRCHAKRDGEGKRFRQSLESQPPTYSAKNAKRMTNSTATISVAGWMSRHLPVKAFSTT